MACDTMHSWWTFCGLAGAFLDLAIVYFLLCASTFGYFASKFLGIFGLSFPCPCNGLFGSPNSNFCAQRLLVEYSTKQVSNVHLSLKNKFPFDSISSKSKDHLLNTKFIREGKNNANSCVEIRGESSCGSALDARKSRNVIGKESSLRNGTEFGAMKQGVKEGKFDLKGKKIINQRTKGGIRRRKKGDSDYEKYSSVSSYDPPCVDLQGVPQSPSSINVEENDITEGSSLSFYSGIETCCFNYDGEPTTVLGSGNRASHCLELNEKNAIRVLEQALEEEQSARAALYHELEKERNAAATAADEVMAMILRLQEEKASTEMEARKFQRVIEEKSAYDAEEMNSLKEILLRREREKLFLEKEVEAYRQMIYPESVGNDMQYMDIQQPLFASSTGSEWQT